MEIGTMSRLGLTIVKEDGTEGTVYVEWHRCDKCGAEYRIYLRSPKGVEKAFLDIAKKLGNRADEQDLCFHCQAGVIVNQLVLPMDPLFPVAAPRGGADGEEERG